MASLKKPVNSPLKSSSSKALWYGSLAAGAAAGSAQGMVIYTDVIPDLTASTVSWDMDNGGTTDFRLEVTGTTEKSQLVPSNPNAGVALTANSNADKLSAGETIGSTTPFSNPGENKTLFDEGTPANYDWSVGARGYLGLRFDLDGSTHYGWAEISINPLAGNSFDHTLYGYAYESTADTSILAGAVPEPSTAMLLVAGAAGAATIRRRRA